MIDNKAIHYREVTLAGTSGFGLGNFTDSYHMVAADPRHYLKLITDTFPLEQGMPAMHPMVDTTEVCEGGEDPVRFIADLQETPCHLHLSDFANGTKHLPVGKGSLDWKQIFSVLGKRQYQGYYTLEPSYRYYLTDIKAKLASARESMRNISAALVLAIKFFPPDSSIPVLVGVVLQQSIAALMGKMLFRTTKE